MAAVAEPQFATLRPEELSYSAQYASIAIREQVVEIQQGIKVLVGDDIAPYTFSSKKPKSLIAKSESHSRCKASRPTRPRSCLEE